MSASAMSFGATLLNVKGVRATIEVRDDQTLVDHHDGIQEAFGSFDDHLYSFWLDNRFWGDDEMEYTSPSTPTRVVRAPRLVWPSSDSSPKRRSRTTSTSGTSGEFGSNSRALGRPMLVTTRA